MFTMFRRAFTSLTIRSSCYSVCTGFNPRSVEAQSLGKVKVKSALETLKAQEHGGEEMKVGSPHPYELYSNKSIGMN
jgi:hypothetical protein